MVQCKMSLASSPANPECCIAAMRNVNSAAAFTPRNAALQQHSP
jgi:hypothetical protein